MYQYGKDNILLEQHLIQELLNLILLFTTLNWGGGACYTNTTNLTTGNFGEWKTEQTGVGTSCNNASQSYFLNININGADQTPRRRLVIFEFLRKDTEDSMKGANIFLDGQKNILIDGRTNFRNMTKGVFRFQHTPAIPNTRVLTFDINANGQENTSAIVMEYNSNGSYLIRHEIGQDVYTWDKNADLHIRDIVGRFIGSLTNRITKLFVQDIDASGNINAANYTLNGTTIIDWDDISSATSINLTNYALKNQSEIFAGNITVGGQVLTDSGCLIPHANFWAERAGAITSGGAPAGLQYSFGDGNTNGGPTQPCSGKIVYMTVHAQNANNGNGKIDIVVNSSLNSSCNVATPLSDDGTRRTTCNLDFNIGDTLTPRTTVTPTGTNNGYVVSWWVVYD